MKLEALDHPKTLDFAARLGVELPTAIGHLELLWAFTGKKTPQGNVGKWPDGAIARACYWMGDPAVFVQALIDAGFLDRDAAHRITVHDWADHAPRWVKAKLSHMDADFVGTTSDDTDDTADETDDTTVVPTRPPTSKGREEKGREGKGSEAVAHATSPPNGRPSRLLAAVDPPPPPPGLNLAAWSSWVAYRKGSGKPIKPVSVEAAMRALAKFGDSQIAVVEQSIANSWQGLFPLKEPPGKPKGGGDNGLPTLNG